jgi:hypothetical protein
MPIMGDSFNDRGVRLGSKAREIINPHQEVGNRKIAKITTLILIFTKGFAG